MWFKRSRKSDISNRSEFVGLPSIPDPIDDNLYLASAVKAAIVDKESGAYDEFLFSENGITEMPFEESLESHLGLVSHRIADQGRRELLIRQQSLLEGQSRVALAQSRVVYAEKQLLESENHLKYQLDILNGSITGHENLLWKDSVPEFTSIPDSRLKLALPALVFLLVGLVDIGIIFTSLTKILKDGNEALLFTLPAIGIQLAFPHLIGDRIRSIVHGSAMRKKNITEASVLAIMWILFCATLTYVRVTYLNSQTEDGLEPLVYQVLSVLNFLMLIGLGSILLFLTSKTNPHYREYHRVNIKIAKQKNTLQRRSNDLEIANNSIPVLEYSLNVTRDSFEQAAGDVNSSLSRAAKKVYRRALVNKQGDVDFTNAYLTSQNKESKNEK
jgi:hypothetical protein